MQTRTRPSRRISLQRTTSKHSENSCTTVNCHRLSQKSHRLLWTSCSRSKRVRVIKHNYSIYKLKTWEWYQDKMEILAVLLAILQVAITTTIIIQNKEIKEIKTTKIKTKITTTTSTKTKTTWISTIWTVWITLTISTITWVAWWTQVSLLVEILTTTATLGSIKIPSTMLIQVLQQIWISAILLIS